MESKIMIDEFISEYYKNAETITTYNGFVKRYKSFNIHGEKRNRLYINNGGNFMILIDIKEKKSTSIFNENSIFDTIVWFGSEEALSVDYRLLADAINKSEGDKKEQL